MKNLIIRLCVPILMAGSLVTATAASAGVDGEHIYDSMKSGSEAATPITRPRAAPARVHPHDEAAARALDRRLKEIGRAQSAVGLVPARDICLGTHLDKRYGGC